jgi:hypothetical protein
MHRCVPSQVSCQVDVANSPTSENQLANALANNDTPAPGRNRCSTTYRYRNPDKRRTYMAAYMRAYRKRTEARAA